MIIIEIEDGIVQNVYTDHPDVTYRVVDRDDESDEPLAVGPDQLGTTVEHLPDDIREVMEAEWNW